jgi:hypothetical protein
MTATLEEVPAGVFEETQSWAEDFEMKAVPRFCSEIPEGTDIEAARKGAWLQRLPITPQGIIVAGVMQSRHPNRRIRYKQVTIQIPRRSTKTTTIQNVLLGRCATMPGYQVVSTAQDGTRASQFFRDMMDLILDHANEIMEKRNEEREEAWDGEGKEPEEFTQKQALAELGIRTMYFSQQREYIKWRNGSKWRVAKPEAGSLRGGAAHAIWFDEGGELDPETAPKLVAGALPMMDTKPEGQVIVSGTPGEARVGLFWNQLEKARAAKDKLGIVDYSADDFCDPTDERVWWRTHPGLACGLTDIDTIRERFDEETGMPLPEFMREYLCIWPPDSSVTALDLQKWGITHDELTLAAPEDVPVGIGWDVAIGGGSAAVAAAWLDENDEPHIQILRHRQGSQWLPGYIGKGIKTLPRLNVAYDSIGQNIVVAQALGRMPQVKTNRVKALSMKDVSAATALLAQSVDLMTLHHGKHAGLDTAVKNATWRNPDGNRLFMRKNGADLSTLLAAVAALSAASTAARRSSLTIPDAATG